MRIEKLKVNHITNPVGFAMGQPVFSYVVAESTGKRQKAAEIRVSRNEDLSDPVFDSGMTAEVNGLAYRLPEEVKLLPATRYYWDVTVQADDGDSARSAAAYFETPAEVNGLSGEFIACAANEPDVVSFFTRIAVTGRVVRARAYATALGIFELRIGGKKAGEEYLTPYSNDYDSWQQVMTFDVTDLLAGGEQELEMIVAPGWYSGVFGFQGKNKIYGEKKAAFLHLELIFEDGRAETVTTDASWKARQTKIRYAEIYHGEVYDASYQADEAYGVEILSYKKEKLSARRSLPVVIKETIRPKRILHTPAGETVLDMGQNMVGWVSFTCREAAGTKLYIQYGEVLQNGNFYRENLRQAKAEFTYIADGNECVVRPHLTYYGFRYAKLEGFTGEPAISDFTGEVIYSDMEQTGFIETSNPLVNRLFLNALWGQKGNFVDVPSDCPQRDERMGWTGDAQVFSGTAAFNMEVFPFYSKYGYDMLKEQEKYDGCVPMVIPSFHMGPGGSAAWADAATVIPWNTYVFSGDAEILRQQYPSMKLWIDYIHRQDEENGGRGLWQTGFHFGDWLALDNSDPRLPTGATDPYYVASAYYYLSAMLTAKAAAVLGKTDDAVYYEKMAQKVRGAIRDEYFTPNGRLAIGTQTAYVIALAFGFVPDEHKARVAEDLCAKIKKDGGKLMTGFVGTPYICKVLSECGYNELAYQLLLNEDCPGWLYPVRMGATTIWERWNSILPDGTINPEGMNSLNHYSYGAIVEWMYRYIGGISPVEDLPGFARILWKPMPDYRMSGAKVRYDSPLGLYESSYKIGEGTLELTLTVPFGGSAHALLPDAPADGITVNGKPVSGVSMEEGCAAFELDAGTYVFRYRPVKPYNRCYSAQMTVGELFADEAVWKELTAAEPKLARLPMARVENVPLAALAQEQMIPVTEEDVARLHELLCAHPILPDQVPEMIMDL